MQSELHSEMLLIDLILVSLDDALTWRIQKFKQNYSKSLEVKFMSHVIQ